MKNGFLKCFAISLGVVFSLQFGSFAAKNVKVSSYKPKTQLVRTKKAKSKANKVSIMSVEPQEVADFAGYYKLDLSKSGGDINSTLDALLEEVNGTLNFVSMNIEKNGEVTMCISADMKEDNVTGNITMTEKEQLIKDADGQFILKESSNTMYVNVNMFVPGFGLMSTEIDIPVDALSENGGFDRFYLKNIDGAEYLVVKSEDGVMFYKKVF